VTREGLCLAKNERSNQGLVFELDSGSFFGGVLDDLLSTGGTWR
jgi:hypothetical protein